MNQQIQENHGNDANGNPAGGRTTAMGIEINWQNGPIPRNEKDEVIGKQNGAFVEGVINAAIGRVEYYQNSKFNCWENANTLIALRTASMWCNKRTQDRIKRKVEGSHKT